MSTSNPDIMAALWSTLLDRRDNPRADSYTSQLLRMGEDEIAKKAGEEAIELVVAAKCQGAQRIVEEAADLTYHLLVVLLAHEVTWDDVLEELAARHQ